MTTANALPIHYAELESIYHRTLARGTRALALTCAAGGEGVTTLARALAERAAAGGRRTLLVDTNLAHPALHGHYGSPREAWSPADYADALHLADVPGLTLLTAPLDGGEFGFRDPGALQAALHDWLQSFDVVIADTSPVNRRNRRNIPAEAVCGAFPATLMVVLAAATPESALVEAHQRLAAAGATLAGAVLNDRHLPGLASELCRETRRLDRLLPRTMAWARAAIGRSALLNQPI
ncbi:MAG TPA: capsular biosynthesis protein [Gammaproteobacteria bacterium]